MSYWLKYSPDQGFNSKYSKYSSNVKVSLNSCICCKISKNLILMYVFLNTVCIHMMVKLLKQPLYFNPHPPEVFFVTHPPKGGLQLPTWIFHTEHLMPLYLLPVHRYGPPLSIDTKMSTIKLYMTSLRSQSQRALRNLDALKIYVKMSKNQFLLKNRRNMGFLQDFWLDM